VFIIPMLSMQMCSIVQFVMYFLLFFFVCVALFFLLNSNFVSHCWWFIFPLTCKI